MQEPIDTHADVPRAEGPDDPTMHVRSTGSASSRARPRFERGATISRYVVLEEVGRGGAGVVLRAYDPKLQREVALKCVNHHALSPEAGARMVREAQAMAKLNHPNVVSVYDVEIEGDEVVLAMEFVAGTSLSTWLKGSPRPWRTIVEAFVQAGRGLQAAHAVGLLHRDFKPANVMMSAAAVAKVTDFGLARLDDGEATGSIAAPNSRSSWSSDSVHQSVTDGTPAIGSSEGLAAVGERSHVMGTPAYMAPEQHRGAALTAAVDQYAFCVSLWQALTGGLPFPLGRRTLVELDRCKRGGPPKWPKSGREVPKRIVDAIVRGLSPAPDDRWPSMAELLARIDPRPRRDPRRWAAVSTVALATSGTLSYATWARERPEPCSGAEAHLVGVWDEARWQAIASALHGTNLAYADDTVARLEPRLREYADAWVATHREACEATTVRGEQSAAVMDLRMGCLQRALVQLRAATQVLASAEAGVLENALDIVDDLPRLDRCDDLEALKAEVAPPEPDERAEVDRIAALLADARALRAAGRYRDSLEVLQRAEAAVETTDYAPIRTDLALEFASTHDQLGHYDRAQVSLEDALHRSVRWAQWDALGRAATSLIRVVGGRQKQTARAIAYAPLVEGLAERSSDRSLEAGLHEALGTVYFEAGRYEDAATEFRRAIGIREGLDGPDDPNIAITRSHLGGALYRLGRPQEAEAEQRAALRAIVAAQGAEHPDVARARNNLGTALYAQGRHDEAEAEFRRALAVQLAAFGPDHPDVASTRKSIGNALFGRGDAIAAEAEYRTALLSLQRSLGPDHVSTGRSHDNLGFALLGQSRYAEAEAEFRAASVVLRQQLGADHPETAKTQANLGYALLMQGRLDEAETEVRGAAQHLEAKLGPDHPTVAEAHHSVGMVLVTRGELGEARSWFERAWSVRKGERARPEERADTAFALAKTLPRDHADRRGLAEAARAIYATLGEVGAERLREVEAWLASSHGAAPPDP